MIRPPAVSPSPTLPPPETAKEVGGRGQKHFVYVFGDSGMGKTIYATAIYRAAVAAGKRAVFVDPKTNYAHLGDVVHPERLGDALAASSTYAYVLQPSWNGDMAAAWEQIYHAGSLLLVVDEAQLYADAGSLDKGFVRLIQTARARNINIVTTAQSPVGLHPKVRQMWDVIVSFRIGVESYATMIAREFLHDARAAPYLRKLQQFEYVRAEVGGALARGRVRPPI